MRLSRAHSLALFLLLLLPGSPVFPQVRINLVFSETTQPPLFFLADGSGLCQDLVSGLNSVQKQYLFMLSTLPPARMTRAYLDHKVDGFLLFNKQWFPNPLEFSETANLLTSREVFIAHKGAGRDATVFDQLGKVSIAGVLGFNYKFAGFNPDQSFLESKFHLTGTPGEVNVVKMVLLDRTVLGIVSESYLAYLKKGNSEGYKGLLVSTVADNEFTRPIQLRKTCPLSIAALDRFLLKLSQRGILTKIYSAYGLTEPRLED